MSKRTRNINELRSRIKSGMKHGTTPRPTLTNIDIQYGYAADKVVVTFNQPVAQLGMSIQQTHDMSGKLKECMTAIQAGTQP